MLPHPTGLDGLAAWQRVVKTPRPHPPAFLVQGPTPISQPQTTSLGGGVNTSTSLNWSGYVDSGSSFTDMKTDYLEETPAGSQPCSNNAISQWAGIGGVNSGNLAQDGTALHEGYAGIPDHGAWAEVLPNGPIYMHFTVNAGDEVQADVQHYGSGFEFTVADLTTGNSYGFFHTTSSYDGSTADAILERPYNGVGGYTTPLTQFSSPDEFFFADPNGNPLNQYTHTDYAMYSQSTGHELAHPGSVFSSDDFYDYYDNCG
ncbi:MAG TPA: G1 family glutamic endopeptidase [Chloroflexota bacterium]